LAIALALTEEQNNNQKPVQKTSEEAENENH
jgi:hypothetical protein